MLSAARVAPPLRSIPVLLGLRFSGWAVAVIRDLTVGEESVLIQLVTEEQTFVCAP